MMNKIPSGREQQQINLWLRQNGTLYSFGSDPRNLLYRICVCVWSLNTLVVISY
eukprot:COSAG06_NODE_10911_length_1597_cov_1.016689_3_plen_54_part_00